MDWLSVFDEVHPVSGASAKAIRQFVATLGRPLSAAEVKAIVASQRNPFPKGDPLYTAYRPFDPTTWRLPQRPLPQSYLSFLQWSNGGWCRSGARAFDFFGAGTVRQMLLAYHLPEYMPDALPFAWNGDGIFYLFDMRQQPVADEYPIVCAQAGNLGWTVRKCGYVADAFPAACCGKGNVATLL